MTISKKLSIAQLLLLALEIILLIVMIITVVNAAATARNTNHSSPSFIAGLATAGVSSILFLLASIAAIVIGILQIVFKVKEQTSGVYLSAGILSLLGLIPFFGWGCAFAALILNIIGVAKK